MRFLPMTCIVAACASSVGLADEQPTVVAVWKHQVIGAEATPSTITLYSNHKINDPGGRDVWSRSGNTLILAWPNSSAPGGKWVDRCTVSPDGKSYSGRNQAGARLVGKLVFDTADTKAQSAPTGGRTPPARTPAAIQNAKKSTHARPNASDDMRLAFQKYMRAADAGDTGAMAELGHLYMTGQGTPRDLVKSAEMFRKGSDAGNRRCTHELGLCYARGVGVTRDFAEAFSLFQRGADANDPDSMHDLGICYFYGRGVKADRAEAQKWLTKSAKAGYRPSQQALASIARSGRTPASGRALSPEQAQAAVGLLWMFSQMGVPSSGSSAGESASDEAFKQHIREQREEQRAETDARIRAREQGIP